MKNLLIPILVLLSLCGNGQDLIPVEILFKDNVYDKYRLSPDGKYFAAEIEHNLGYEITVIDLNELYTYENIPVGNKVIDNIVWIDSRRLAYEVDGKIYTINIDGTDNKLLLGIWHNDAPEHLSDINYEKYLQFNEIKSSLWFDKEHILVQSINHKGYANIYQLNIFTGEQKLIEDGKKEKINSWIINKEGEPILALRYKNDIIELLSKKDGVWTEFQVTINNEVYNLNIEGKTYLNNDLVYLGVGYGNSIYLGSRTASDKQVLIEYSLDDHTIKPILADEFYDIGESVRLLFDDKTKKLIGVSYQRDKPTTKWFTNDLDLLQETLTSKYPDFYVNVIDVNQDASVFLTHIWHPSFPGRIGLVKKDSSELISILTLNKDIEKYSLTNTQIINIKTRDGVPLIGYLNIPKNKFFDQTPLVVIPHGGPWARDYYYFEPFSQFFADRGYATLRLNFRGSVGFGKKFLLAGIKNIHSTMIDDIYDGASYCVNNFNLDSNNVFMFGHSYGGYASVMSTINYPDFYNSITSVSSPYDIHNWLKLQKKEKNKINYELWEAALGNHRADKDFIKKISPVYNAEKIKVPILIFHGEKDKIIPVEQAHDFAKKLEKNNVKYEFIVIKREGHSLKDSNNYGYILKKAEEFFQSQMKENL